MKRIRNKRNSGIILLVVLSMLTFFSLLVAAYLVFATQAEKTSYVLATRTIKQPDPNAFMEEALMTLIRGTNDVNHPFYGEDLLSDYYGRNNFLELVVRTGSTPTEAGGFITFRASEESPTDPLKSKFAVDPWDDIYAGRIITFTSGNLANRSFRVLRSAAGTMGTTPPVRPLFHDFVIQATDGIQASDISASDTLRMNSAVRNSPGLGYASSGTVHEVNQTTDDTNLQQPRNPNSPYDASTNPAVGFTLPISLQPNHLGRNVDKSALLGDFDEEYDAPDYYNWFLSYRDPVTGNISPSFHRPAVVNYIVNEVADWSGASATDYNNVMASLARGTMRPLPIAAGQFGSSSPSVINQRFTGGNANFALRAPLRVANANSLNQIVKVLTGDVANPYDVDNDFDGVTDSIWLDIDLPVFSSPEGKLLKPLIAPMIEDLSGRLNVNAHGNFALLNQSSMLSTYSGQFPLGTTPLSEFHLFNGRGFGPAEINFPGVSATDLSAILQARYASASTGTDNVPGKAGADALSILTGRFLPAKLNMNAGYRDSVDPYGRGGVGISPAGSLVSVNVGTDVTTPTTTNEATDHPYEFDPSGKLSGDRPFTASELEPILRVREYDTDLLPTRLLDLAYPLISANPDFARALTTISKSDDSPASMDPTAPSAYAAFARLINGALTNAQLKKLIAPELRLGRKLDVNRALGNGIDDNFNNVIDDPSEYSLTGVDDDGDGAVDEGDETSTETLAFRSLSGATIDSRFASAAPKYNFDETSPVAARQLLARHLYVLMMTISRDLDNSTPGRIFPTYGDRLSPAKPVSDRERYRARRLAQWAINVVDYRDPDAIMTPFEYDENPFDGWGVDGNLLTTEATGQVVWGVENPELVFTESSSYHDVRVRDTSIDSSGKKKDGTPMDDDDTDQMRIPQGSTFFELYATRERFSASSASPWIAGIPQEIYNVVDNGTEVDYAIDLDRTVTTYFDNQGDANPTNDVYGDSSDTAYQVPVWRIAISEPHYATPAPPAVLNSPLTLRDDLPDTLSFEPTQLDELGVATNTLALQRFVFFNHFPTVAAMQNSLVPLTDITSMDRVYFNYLNRTTNLLPEQYLSLAPRTITHLGSKIYPDLIDPTLPQPQGPSGQQFRVKWDTAVDAGKIGLMQYDLAADPVNPTTPLTLNTVTVNASTPPTTTTAARTQDGLALVIAGRGPTGWTTPLAEGIGLNISEPFASSYYAEPTEQYSTSVPGYPLRDAYVELDTAGNAANGIPRDQPEDMRVNGPIRELTQHFADPASADPMLGTVGNYRTAFLQRLSDPRRGFHPILNPYRTVDQIALDLTIFSGEERPAEVKKSGDGTTPVSIENSYVIGSRQRDGISIDGTGTNVLYSYSAPLPATIGPNAIDAVPNAYFEFPGATSHVQTTFNYLNSGFGNPQPGLNVGRPTVPFAVHPWLNRPFATPMELILVPACSQGRLFEEFSIAPGGIEPDIYPDVDQPTPINDADRARLMLSPFRHMLNFFHSQDRRNYLPASAPTESSSEFSSLFDFVTTPPQFRGEVEAVNPANIAANANLSPLMSAPFNFLYDNIRTGTINLNTIATSLTWEGLMQGHLNVNASNKSEANLDTMQLSWKKFQNSRRGYLESSAAASPVNAAGTPAYNYDPLQFDPRYPTQFAGVFRQSKNASHVPIVRDSITTADTDTANGSDVDSLVRRPVNTTLFRAEGTIDLQEGRATTGKPNTTALFVRDKDEAPKIPDPTAAPFADRNRNPFVRYQTLMRMPNLVSDNSQVYLIRLTMGFFEVDASNINDLGAEYNEQIGQQKRYHAMFIVDRSIPVGFAPGQDLNARNTVIFERFFQ